MIFLIVYFFLVRKGVRAKSKATKQNNKNNKKVYLCPFNF